MSDDEDFYDDYSHKLTDIQLGFVHNDVNKLFLEDDWTKWDGGKVGGMPIWLDKGKIPDATALECKNCGDPNLFLLQIYCPLDNYDPSAFHRCLYVFCCKKATCNEKGSIQCLRSQLPKENRYYRKESDIEGPPPSTAAEALNLCAVCGLQGSYCCSACASSPLPVRYCSKKHQQIDWKIHKHSCGKAGEVTAAAVLNPAVLQNHKRNFTFEEYDICIEEEDLQGEEDNPNGESNAEVDIGKALKSSKINPDTIIWEDAVTEGGEDEKADADLKQGDYDKALGNEESDPLYSKFLSRVRLGGDKQVLRYFCGDRVGAESGDGEDEIQDDNGEADRKASGDHMPLAVSSSGYVGARDIPPCEHCQAPRVFEFQIMPQLLHFLKVDHGTQINKLKCLDSTAPPSTNAPSDSQPSEKDVFVNATDEDIDWGSIDVFTCSRSCAPPSGKPYLSEYCWRQPPPVVSGHQLDGPSSSASLGKLD